MEEEGLSDDDKIKEEIRFNIEKLRLAMVALLTIGGGTVSMINSPAITGKSAIFIAWGMLFCLWLISRLYNAYRTLKQLIR